MKYEIIKWSLKNGTTFRDLPREILTSEEWLFVEEYLRQKKLIEAPTLRSVATQLAKDLSPNQVKELVGNIKSAEDIDLAQYQLTLPDLREQACQKIVEKLARLKTDDPKLVKDLYDRLIELRTVDTSVLPEPINVKNWQSLYDASEDEMMLDIPWFQENEVPFKKKVLYSYIATTNGGKTIIKTWTAHEFIKKGYNVLFLAQEEPYIDTIRRIHQATLGLTEDGYKEITRDGFEKVGTMYNEKAKELGYGEFEVAEWTGATPNDIKRQLREYKKRGLVIDTVIIDYAKLIETNNAQRNAQEWERIGRIFKELKELAMKENVCIVTSIQLNRDSSQRLQEQGRRPDIYDVAGAYEAIHHVNYAWTLTLSQISTEGLSMDYMDPERILGNYTLTVQKQKYGRLRKGDDTVFAWRATHTLHSVRHGLEGAYDDPE